MDKVIENPFEIIERRLTRQDQDLQSIKQLLKSKKEREKRIVGLVVFAEYSGWRPQTVYTKLHKGEVIPGCFKLPGSKFWNFDLNIWDQHLREAQENQYKEG